MGWAGWRLVAAGAAFGCGCGSSPSGQASVGGFAPTGSVAPSTPSSVFESVGPVDPLTTAGLQSALVAQVTAQLPPGTQVSATCGDVPTTSRSSVHCTVTIAGTAVDWLVTNQQGTVVDSAPAVGLLRLADARAAVARLFSDYANPTVDCGPGVVVVVKQDDEVQCVISSGAREHSAHVVVTDVYGHFQVTP